MMAKKGTNKRGGGATVETPERFMREKARRLPLGKCYVSAGWREMGAAHVVVTRVRPSGNLTVGSFLVDCQCLGVKWAACYPSLSPEQFAERIAQVDPATPLEEVAYQEVHNLIYGAVEFAEEGGIVPAREFALARYVLEEDTDDVPLIEYDFGKAGRHNLRTAGLTLDEVERYKALLDDNLDCDFMIDGRPRFGALFDMPEREVYSYRHPEYPSELRMKHQFVADELLSADNFASLPDDVVERILALPADEAATDLAQVILYEIGRTYREIADGTADAPDDSAIFHALLLLSHIDSDRGLGAVLLLMCQSSEFADFHLSDYMLELIYPALYVAGRNRMSDIEAYLRRPGLDSFVRAQAGSMIALTAKLHPERRDEMIGVMGRWLDFIAGHIAERKGCDGDLAGFVMSNLIAMKAVELLPQIKTVFDTGCVNLTIAGDYQEVAERMESRKDASSGERYEIPDITSIYSSLREAMAQQDNDTY